MVENLKEVNDKLVVLNSQLKLWTGNQGNFNDYPQIISYLFSLQGRHTFKQKLSLVLSALEWQQIWIHRPISSSEWNTGYIWERGRLQALNQELSNRFEWFGISWSCNPAEMPFQQKQYFFPSGETRSSYLDLCPQMTSSEDLLYKGKPFTLTSVATSQTHSLAHPRRMRIKFDLPEQLYTKKS